MRLHKQSKALLGILCLYPKCRYILQQQAYMPSNVTVSVAINGTCSAASCPLFVINLRKNNRFLTFLSLKSRSYCTLPVDELFGNKRW